MSQKEPEYLEDSTAGREGLPLTSRWTRSANVAIRNAPWKAEWSDRNTKAKPSTCARTARCRSTRSGLASFASRYTQTRRIRLSRIPSCGFFATTRNAGDGLTLSAKESTETRIYVCWPIIQNSSFYVLNATIVIKFQKTNLRRSWGSAQQPP